MRKTFTALTVTAALILAMLAAAAINPPTAEADDDPPPTYTLVLEADEPAPLCGSPRGLLNIGSKACNDRQAVEIVDDIRDNCQPDDPSTQCIEATYLCPAGLSDARYAGFQPDERTYSQSIVATAAERAPWHNWCLLVIPDDTFVTPNPQPAPTPTPDPDTPQQPQLAFTGPGDVSSGLALAGVALLGTGSALLGARRKLGQR